MKGYSVHMRNDLFRFVKGVIAVKLNDNPRVNKLFQLYYSMIIERGRPDGFKIEIDRLKAILTYIGRSIICSDYTDKYLGGIYLDRLFLVAERKVDYFWCWSNH